jgi:class 3 adenylate cyclase
MFDNDNISAQSTADDASNALALAKEMIIATRQVPIPNIKRTLEIRVGIHVGELSCGVLGERLPKFTVFGSSVMQTCHPSTIRVTKAFHDALSQVEDWQEKEIITVKNMGGVDTYMLNPFQ